MPCSLPCPSLFRPVLPFSILSSLPCPPYPVLPTLSLYSFLVTQKTRKIHSFIPHHPTTLSSLNTSTVYTIPNELYLVEFLILFLSKNTPSEFDARAKTERFLRQDQLGAFFYNRSPLHPIENDFTTPKKHFSNWTPNLGLHCSVDTFINKCSFDLGTFNFNRKARISNLPPSELDAFRVLCQHKDIVIKTTDKQGAVVVWWTDLYRKVALRQLNDPRHYIKISSDLINHFHNNVSTTVHQLIFWFTAANLKVSISRTSTIYFFPKIHITDRHKHPIVFACNCLTELLSSYFENFLSHLVTALPSYIKYTNYSLRLFNAFSFPPGEFKLLFTMAVKSLYAIIPHNDGLLNT